MDWLKQVDLDSKKRQLEQSYSSAQQQQAQDDSHATKYIKRSDLERSKVQQQKEQEEQEERDKQERLFAQAKKVASLEDEENSTLASGAAASTSDSTTTDQVVPGAKLIEQSKPEAFNVSNEEAVRRLRAKGQPIRLFGESDKDRRLRLRALELIEERTEGQRNDFMKAMDGMEMGLDLQEMAKKVKEGGATGGGDGAKERRNKGKGKVVLVDDTGTAGEDSAGDELAKDAGSKEPNPKDEEVIVDVGLVKTNPHKLYPQIYHALKRVLKEWEQSLKDRPESVRRSTQGKMASATQQTSAEYLKPLFKSLRKRDLLPDVLQAIAEITYNMQVREYLRANDAYLRLSIGNAPWPIGVTMVGIHERSGREKIFSNNVAHVLNDETSRKYIQSLKRLLTFAQTVRPPSDLSQLMG